jgi:peptide/nickel transport system ATP-binding protein
MTGDQGRRMVLCVEHLRVASPAGEQLVDGVSLALREGHVLSLIGETGSGKSLVAAAIMGLTPPGLRVTGRMRFGDGPWIDAADARALTAHWRCDTMLAPQEPSLALDPTMRVGRQMRLAGVSAEGVSPALARVDLAPAAAAAHPFTLSGGMAQRVLIATALAVGSPVLIADEPTKGLDAERVEQAAALLMTARDEGRALLVITHDLGLARRLGGLAMVMRDGRCIEADAASMLLDQPRAAYTRALLDADPARWRKTGRPAATHTPVVDLEEVGFGWPRGDALFSGVSFAVHRGEIVAVTGPSGAGKSTLGNIALGLLPPRMGRVRWSGRDPYASGTLPCAERQRFQKLHQDPLSSFAPHRPVGRQIADLTRVRPGLDVEADLPPLLDRLKLRAQLLRRFPAEISGGEAQRLALARLLLLKPALIVADEPTSRLDPIVQRDTIDLLRECVADYRLALLLISHDTALVEAVAHRRFTLRAPSRTSGQHQPDVPAA